MLQFWITLNLKEPPCLLRNGEGNGGNCYYCFDKVRPLYTKQQGKPTARRDTHDPNTTTGDIWLSEHPFSSFLKVLCFNIFNITWKILIPKVSQCQCSKSMWCQKWRFHLTEPSQIAKPVNNTWKIRFTINPFTPKSDQCQISPAPSPEIFHHTVWRT